MSVTYIYLLIGMIYVAPGSAGDVLQDGQDESQDMLDGIGRRCIG